MIKYEQFYRTYMIRRIVDLDRVTDLDDIPEMPRGAIIHCLDNLYRPEDNLMLTPNDKNIFIQKEPSFKYYHALASFNPDPNDVIVPNDEGVRPKVVGMLMSELATFRREHNRTWRQCASIEAIPDRADVMGVVSYNTLFNVRVSGVYPKIRFLNYILACLVNTLARVRNMKRPHIIHFPIQSKIYQRELFIKALQDTKFDKGRDSLLEMFKAQNFDIAAQNDLKGETTKNVDRSVIRLPNDLFYLLMLHWLCFINSKSTYSIFEYIPKEMLPYIVFAFTSGKKVLFYSLPDMIKMNGSSDAIIIRMIRQMNSLALSNENELFTRVSESSNSEEPKETPIKDVKKEVTSDEVIKLSTAAPEPSTVDDLPEQFRVSEIDIDLDGISKEPTIDPKYITVNPKEGQINAPVFDGNTDTDDLKDFIADTIKEMESIAAHDINTDTRLSPLQKTKMIEISESWKSVKMDDVPIEKLVTQPAVQTLTPVKADVSEFTPYGGDASMGKSSIAQFDQEYMEKTYKQHLAKVFTAFSKNGMYLTDIETQPVSNQMNRETKYKLTYVDSKRKKHPIRFTLPKVDEYGLCWINGAEKRMQKQRVSLPICKTSAERVTLNSCFNKTLVERNTSVVHSFYPYFLKMIQKAEGKRVILDYGLVDLKGKVLPYEYTQLARHHPKMEIESLFFTFDFDHRAEYLDASIQKNPEILKELESEYGVFFGVDKKTKEEYFIKLDGTVNIVDLESKSLIAQGSFIDVISKILGSNMSPLQEVVEMKILDKELPLGFILCYRFGLIHMLKYLKTDYKIYPRNQRKVVQPSDIILNFADYSVVIKRVPYVNSLIFAGLNNYELKDIPIAEMESKDIYYDLIQSKHMSINYIKGIDTHFDFFIDPITAEVLQQMHEPTNFKDLVIRATALLSTEEHLDPSSSSNFRFRSYEIIPALVYNEIARGLDRYRNKSLGASNVFSINADAVKQRFLQDQLVSNTDGLNPIQDLRKRTLFSHTGFGGRSVETFMIDDRKFTDDQRGIVSEATVSGSTVAVVAGLSMDPNIVNTLGMTKSKGAAELSPTEMLSTTALLLPGITQDDGKRAYLAGLQTAQYMPTVEGEVSLNRTSYERVLARVSRPPYAFPAQQDGVIESIDEAVHLMRIVYKDGTKDVVPFGDQFTRNSSSGFYNTNRVVINNFKEGEKFKQGDILSFNKDAFKADPYSKQVDWKIGVYANVAMVECDDTLDDCSAITASLARKLGVIPVFPFLVMVNKDTIVHSYKKIGEHVDIREPLIVYDKSDVPDSLRSSDQLIMDVLSKINKTTEKSNHAGQIARIDAFYTCPISEMSPSLQSIVKSCTTKQNALSNFAKNTRSEERYVGSDPITTDFRVEGVVPEDDSVILRFYIQEEVDMDAGSKVVYSTELKSVVGYIIPQQLDTESGAVKVDALMSMRAANARIVYSPFCTGASARVLDKLKTDVLQMYEDGKKKK